MSSVSSSTIPIRQIVADGLHRENVVTVRMLALCPMLAVSVSVKAAMTLGLLTLLVMAVAGCCVSLVRERVLFAVRLPIFLIIVATLVAVLDIGLEAFMPTMHKNLGIFLPLIVTNCAVLARLEVFASKQPPIAAFGDGVMSGAGMLAAIVALAIVRELLATGGIAPLFQLAQLPTFPVAALPAGGFFLFALLIVLMRRLRLAR